MCQTHRQCLPQRGGQSKDQCASHSSAPKHLSKVELHPTEYFPAARERPASPALDGNDRSGSEGRQQSSVRCKALFERGGGYVRPFPANSGHSSLTFSSALVFAPISLRFFSAEAYSFWLVTLEVPDRKIRIQSRIVLPLPLYRTS